MLESDVVVILRFAGSFIMNEWYDSQKKPNINFRKLPQERLDKANPRRTLIAEEQKRLAKLEGLVERLKCEENIQNRQLQTWLS